MPELPELEVVRRRLGPRLEGRVIEAVGVSRRFGFLLRTPVDALASALTGQRIDGFWRRGKFLVVAAASRLLVVNPMLGGRLRWSGPGERATDSTLVSLVLDGGDELRLTDSARMARVYLAAPDSLDGVPGWDGMGPEATEIGLEEWRRRIRRHPGELKNLLRNQAFVAGIGNAYSDEILFSARLLPLRRRTSLGVDDVERLWQATGETLRWAIEEIVRQPGWTSEKQDRSFLRVHLRGGRECVRCGHRVGELTARGEVTSFCRGCQA